jgi:hypothetical protein
VTVYLILTAETLKKEIATWLTAPDPSNTHNRLLGEHHNGTGSWFLETEAFQVWKDTPASCLWLYGIRESWVPPHVAYLRCNLQLGTAKAFYGKSPSF